MNGRRTRWLKPVIAVCLLVWMGLFWMAAGARGSGPSAEPGVKASARDRNSCLECHDESTAKTLEASPHARLSCRACHPLASKIPHDDQPPVNCQACHPRHGEARTRDAHLSVTCQACHVEDVVPVRDVGTGRVGWRAADIPGRRFQAHALAAVDRKEACRRCHAAGNTVGAAAAVLPAKSILCLACHPATLAVGDTVTIISLAIFFLGLGWLCSVWFSGEGVQKNHRGSEFSSGAAAVLGAAFFDVLLQRRLWRQSPRRWAVHGLIFHGMLWRFLWGLAALVLSRLHPEGRLAWVLLDVNVPITAFLFDLTGGMILLGVLLAWRHKAHPGLVPPDGLPRSDWWAIGLLGGSVVLGFIVEGARIAMSAAPPGSRFAFLGAAVSRLLIGRSGLTELYPWLWYVHAGLWGAFVAYIPFSRLLHIILAPVVLIANAARGRRAQGGK